MTTGTAKQRPKGAKKKVAKKKSAKKPAGGTTTIKCAFCDGTGKDPWKAMSSLSNCPVCEGRGTVSMPGPLVACAYCHGTGRQPHTRLTCQVCKGAGHVTMAGPTATCPECDGSGKAHGMNLPCTLCGGIGLVAKDSARAKTSGGRGSAGAKTPKAKKRSGLPAKDFVTAECAFCGGIGKDPYEVLSKLSNCPVCNGHGTVRVRRPAHPCAFCHGTGKKRRTRLSCEVCKGTGLVTVPEPAAKCPDCDGTGKMHGADLPCRLCKGTGLITRKPSAQKRKKRTASKASTGNEK